VIVLEGMCSGTIEYMGPPMSLFKRKVARARSVKKEKKKQTNLMRVRHQTQYFPVTLTQATIVHAAKTSIPRPPTEKAKGGEAEGAGVIARPKSRPISSSAC